MKVTRGGAPPKPSSVKKKKPVRKAKAKKGKAPAGAVDALEATDPGLQLAGLAQALRRLADALEELEAGELAPGTQAQHAMEGLRS